MQHTRFNAMPCPIARGLDRVGAWWSILILRNAFRGMTRFDQFQKNLGIAPNILSRRLRGLVQAGVLEKIRYNDRPPRDEYVLTEIGRDFRPVLGAMLTWGNKHFMPDGRAWTLVDADIGLHAAPLIADPVMVDPETMDDVIDQRLDQTALGSIRRPQLNANRRQS